MCGDNVIGDFRAINSAVWKEFEAGNASAQVIRTRRFVLLLERLNIDADSQALSDRFIEHLSEASYLVCGARELLEALSGRVPLVMVTNGLSSVQRSRFARAGMGHYFHDVVISEDVGVQKPDVAIFRLALQRASSGAGEPIEPHESIMIGDNLNSDIRGAQEAGLDTCWVNLRDRVLVDGVQPTFTVTELAQIPALLDT